MMILDAISAANSEHAVHFLVTAYMESLHHFHRSLGLPAEAVELPLQGTADLHSRLELLSYRADVPFEKVLGVAEARAVFIAALARLAVLARRSGNEHRQRPEPARVRGLRNDVRCD